MNILANLLHEGQPDEFEIDFLHKIYYQFMQRLDDPQNALRILAAKVNQHAHPRANSIYIFLVFRSNLLDVVPYNGAGWVRHAVIRSPYRTCHLRSPPPSRRWSSRRARVGSIRSGSALPAGPAPVENCRRKRNEKTYKLCPNPISAQFINTYPITLFSTVVIFSILQKYIFSIKKL